MSEQKYICSGSKLITLADAIRAKSKTTDTLTLDQMATAINNLSNVEKIGSGDYFVGWYSDPSGILELQDSQVAANIINKIKVYAKFQATMPIVRFSTGSDQDVTNMIAAAQAGLLKLSDYWSVGDTRPVQLSAMSAIGVGESHVAQEVEIVLMDFQQLYDYADGSGKCQVIWGLKNGFANGTEGEYGYMHNVEGSSGGGWSGCSRRTWCNEVFFKALPEWMQLATKQVSVISSISSSESKTATSVDYCFLPTEKEVFGVNNNSYMSEKSLIMWEWFDAVKSCIRSVGTGTEVYSWWLRSSSKHNVSYYVYATPGPSSRYGSATSSFQICPCGCF